jgi:hypothetical protein
MRTQTKFLTLPLQLFCQTKPFHYALRMAVTLTVPLDPTQCLLERIDPHPFTEYELRIWLYPKVVNPSPLTCIRSVSLIFMAFRFVNHCKFPLANFWVCYSQSRSVRRATCDRWTPLLKVIRLLSIADDCEEWIYVTHRNATT